MTASTRARSAAARWPWLLGLGALVALYAWHAGVWVPRAGYTVHSDPDAAGWSSALAARVRAGEPLYAHAATAFAPGGVALMALVQRVTGRVTLADELTLVALLRPVLALAAGLVGAAVRGWGAGLVLGLGTLVVSVGFSPGGVELWVAAPLAWCSTASLLHAWAGNGPPTPASATPARRALVVAGALGGLAVAFDQGQGAAALLGGALALAVVPGAGGARALGPFGAGVALGLLGVPLLGLSLGGAVLPTLREVIWGPLRDGGTIGAQLQSLALQVFQRGVLLGSLLNIALVAWVLVRAARAPGGLSPGALLARPGLLGARGAAVLSLGAALSLGLGVAAAGRDGAPLSPWLALIRGHLDLLPALGLAVACVVLMARPGAPADADPAPAGAGARFRALVVVTLVAIPVLGVAFRVTDTHLALSLTLPTSLLALHLVGAPAGARWLAPAAVVAGGLATAIGLAQRPPLPTLVSDGFWRGQRTGLRGQEVMAAAARVRELAGPSGTVLVVPGDLALEAVIGLPRPRLRGALPFASSYPAWAVAGDLAQLRVEPPQVIVVHPAQTRDWERLFGERHRQGGAAQFTRGVVNELLPAAYRRDQTFRTAYRWGQGSLEVWVRR